MPSGSCWCGACAYSFTGEPALKAICHCLTCRFVSGSTNTVNFVVPDAQFTLTRGQPKEFAKKHESGMTLTIYFCGNCGSTIWKTGTADMFKNVKLVQAGTLLDKDLLNANGVGIELYVSERAPWLKELQGTGQMHSFTNDSKL